jgi:hypothetical protein
MGPTGATGAQGPGAPTLETNGTTNGSQSLLNLKNGSNIGITQDGSGNVTIANTAAGGGNYNGFGMWQLSLPALSGLSFANQGSSVSSSGTNFLGIAEPVSAAGRISALHKACPSAPWDLYALVVVSGQAGGSYTFGGGLEMDDGTKVFQAGMYVNTTGAIDTEEWATFTTGSGGTVVNSDGNFPVGVPFWIHINDTSGSLAVDYSFNGLGTPGTTGWRRLTASTNGGLSSVTNCGFYVYGNLASISVLDYQFSALSAQ